MKVKSSVALVALGVGGTLLYENIRNGNFKKMMKKMKKMKKIDINAMKDLEDMI